MPICCGSPFRTARCRPPSCACWRMWRATMTAATAISPPGQNIQSHWIKLEDLPDVMADLARAGLHGMQTSGNCVRNITTDQWAGVAPGEIEDPRISAEILRQHSTQHPEFSFLPRKFKIALTASAHDRAAVRVHDIGLHMKH